MIGATAALCYWFPKVTARMLNERIGKVAFWMIAIGIQITYFGQFWEGFQGMPRRVAYYDPIFLRANQMSTAGAYLLMLGWIVLLYAMIHSIRHGKRAPANPWYSKTLEWHVPTPVPMENFLVDPVVTSDPYTYGEPEPEEPSRPEPELVPVGTSEQSGTGGDV
jgi:cytochrome c oxidase subunit 1